MTRNHRAIALALVAAIGVSGCKKTPETVVPPPDTTQHAPVQNSILQNAPPAETDEYGFGAFGVPVPRSEDDGAACAIREKRTLR